MSELVGVPAPEILFLWDQVEPFIARCLKKSKEHRWLPQDILKLLLRRDQQLWIVREGAKIQSVVTTEILHYPRAKEMNIFIYAGKLHPEWRDHLELLCKYAKSQGCWYVSTTTRKGFVKVLGWEARQTYVIRGVK